MLISLREVDYGGFYPITLLLVIPTGAPSTDGGQTGERDTYINSYKQNERDDFHCAKTRQMKHSFTVQKPNYS